MLLFRRLLRRYLKEGTLAVIDPGGHREQYGRGEPRVTIRIHDASWPHRVLWKPALAIGMKPLSLGREISAHIADRLLESVWRESLWLVKDGIATTEEIDACKGIAVQGVGMMKRALDETIRYVKERHAFGKPIMAFQNTQFKLAELKTKATIAEVFCHHCSERLIEGTLDASTASMAKYWVSDIQCELIDECVQLHGGYGFMNEYPIARMWRDARVQRIYGGTNEIMKLLISRTL